MIQGKKIIIIGFGKEGRSAAKFLGKANQITVYDDKEKTQIEGIDRFDLIVRSPGVRPDHPLVKKLAAAGAAQTSPTQIFFDLAPCPIVAVTGTKGKGTTSTLIYEMLKTQYENVFLAGNIGTPALEILPKLTEESLVVLELSSFQLMDLTKSPHVAVVLMITQEHLDWHQDEEEYLLAKTPIVKYQGKTDFAVINWDFPNSKNLANFTKAKIISFSTQGPADLYISGDSLMSGKEIVANVSGVLIPGRHNLQNVLAAIAAAKIYKIKNENLKKVISSFKGLDNRLQLIREVGGVVYYNDSFSTTPETTIAAIGAFTAPKILILGGSSKNSDFSNLGKAVAEDKTVKGIILIGVEGGRIKEAIEKAGKFGGQIAEGAKNMKEIIASARSLAQNGDIVILSPACASFDMFKNYEDRGRQFASEVNKLT